MLSWLRIGSVSRRDKVNEWASDLLGFLGVVIRLHKCSIDSSSCCVPDRRQPIVKACAGICSRRSRLLEKLIWHLRIYILS